MALDHDADPNRRDPARLAQAQSEQELGTLIGLLRPVAADQASIFAKEQIERHGTLASILAHACTVQDPDPVTTYLRTVSEALAVASRGTLIRAPIIATSRAAADYLMMSMAHLRVEHLRVLFLSSRNHLIAEEDIARGTIDQAPVYPREIVKRALEVGAASLIIAHNHPSGDPSPSRQDIAITQQIITGATALNIYILDHLVLSVSGWTSLRAEGLI